MGIRQEIQGQWKWGGLVKRLLFINIGVFLLVHAIGITGWLFGSPDLDGPVLRQLMSTNDPDLLLRKPWTVVTYMFTHYDPMHILWNMLMFWFSGQLFQSLLNERRLLGNYLLGGLAGFAFYLLGGLMPEHLQLGGTSMILGASASVMSVLVGIATYRPDMEVGLMFAGRVRLKYIALVALLLDLISIRAGGNTGGHLAHIGGALYGYVAALQLKRGNDWSLAFVNGLDRLLNVFRRKGGRGRMRVVERRPLQRVRVVHDDDFNAAKKAKQERVDAILDKISRSGYDSLSKDERDFLFRASNEH
jgi:membrane associated rhomboid family serine protease